MHAINWKTEDIECPAPDLGLPTLSPVSADTGLGTTFERWALNRALESLRQQYRFEQVLEAPEDGMTGISGLNSLSLALQGVDVTLLLPGEERVAFARQVWGHHAPQARVSIQAGTGQAGLPFGDGAFDLVWNFNVINRSPAPDELLAEMTRTSRAYVLFFVPNRGNYGFWLHRLHHRVARQPWDHGPPELLHPSAWRSRLERAGLRLEKTFWVDCPWWPDIIDLGEMAADFFPLLKRPPLDRLLQRARPESRMRWEAQDLPYYRPDLYPAVHAQMDSLAKFENSPRQWLKMRFAHHLAIFAVKET